MSSAVRDYVPPITRREAQARLRDEIPVDDTVYFSQLESDGRVAAAEAENNARQLRAETFDARTLVNATYAQLTSHDQSLLIRPLPPTKCRADPPLACRRTSTRVSTDRIRQLRHVVTEPLQREIELPEWLKLFEGQLSSLDSFRSVNRWALCVLDGARAINSRAAALTSVLLMEFVSRRMSRSAADAVLAQLWCDLRDVILDGMLENRALGGPLDSDSQHSESFVRELGLYLNQHRLSFEELEVSKRKLTDVVASRSRQRAAFCDVERLLSRRSNEASLVQLQRCFTAWRKQSNRQRIARASKDVFFGRRNVRHTLRRSFTCWRTAATRASLRKTRDESKRLTDRVSSLTDSLQHALHHGAEAEQRENARLRLHLEEERNLRESQFESLSSDIQQRTADVRLLASRLSQATTESRHWQQLWHGFGLHTMLRDLPAMSSVILSDASCIEATMCQLHTISSNDETPTTGYRDIGLLRELHDNVEAFLVHWTNSVLSEAGSNLTVLLPRDDLMDGEVYIFILKGILTDCGSPQPRENVEKRRSSANQQSSASFVSGLLQAAMEAVSSFPLTLPILSYCPYILSVLRNSCSGRPGTILLPDERSWHLWMLVALFSMKMSVDVVRFLKPSGTQALVFSSVKPQDGVANRISASWLTDSIPVFFLLQRPMPSKKDSAVLEGLTTRKHRVSPVQRETAHIPVESRASLPMVAQDDTITEASNLLAHCGEQLRRRQYWMSLLRLVGVAVVRYNCLEVDTTARGGAPFRNHIFCLRDQEGHPASLKRAVKPSAEATPTSSLSPKVAATEARDNRSTRDKNPLGIQRVDISLAEDLLLHSDLMQSLATEHLPSTRRKK